MCKFFNRSTNRNHFTSHGLHMNNLGKDWLTNYTAMKIKDIFAAN